MSLQLGRMGLNAKVALLGVNSVLITAVALVVVAVWQSGQYNRLAQGEVDGLIESDLNHITQGVYNLVRTENEAVQQQIDHDLKIARHVLSSAGELSLSRETVCWTAVNQFTGETITVHLPMMLVGGQWLGRNTDPAVETLVVDDVIRLIGESASIFQQMNEKGDMLRVATTVQDAKGKRAIGTYIPAVNPDGTLNPVIAAIQKGQPYHGRAFVVNAWHLTAYEPIRDTAGNVIGMLNASVKQEVVESRLREAILQTKVGKTGYVYVLSGQGENRGRYIISQRGERDGEDIWESRDSDGRYVIQEITHTAMALKSGELATVRYRWKNPEDTTPRWKIARLAYYAPWDWVIGTSVYEDELQSYRAFLRDGRIQMTSTMCLAGLAITLLIGLVGVLIAWTVTHPVQQMTKAVETIIEGDLSQKVDVRSRDEIGALALAFNVMTCRLSQTMEGLRKSEEKYRYIFENAIEGLFQTTIEGRFLSASPAMARMLGYDSPEGLMASVTNLQQQAYVHPEDRDAILAAVVESGIAVEKEVQFYRKDKQVIWVSLSMQAMRDNAGQLLFLQGFVTDITERKRAEKEIRKLNEELEQRVAHRTAQLELVNAELKKEIVERKQAEEALKHRLKFENLMAGISSDFTTRAVSQIDQGITRALEGVGSFVEADRSSIVLFSGNGPEMSMTHEWCAKGVEPRILGSGHEPMDALPWLRDQLDKLELVRISAMTNLPPEAEQEKRYFEAGRTKSCVIVPLVCGGVLKGFVGFDVLRSERSWSDDTVGLLWTATQSLANALQNKWAEETRLALESQLYHAQQLESIGHLAAGIAHEINTPTQFVGDNTRFLRDAFGDLIKLIEDLERVVVTARKGQVDQDLLDKIEQARSSVDIRYLQVEIPKAIDQSLEGIHRVSKIVRAMREFSHPDLGEKVATDLNRAIETTVTVARNEWKYIAEMKLELDPTLPLVACIPGEINQVILNLIVNAAHAIMDKLGSGSTDKGTITIRTKREGDAVEIRVADTGTGIPEKYRARMFMPFFTTKTVGKGTGQGLAIAYNVIHIKHGGTIHFETETGQGTTFIIRLPRSETDS